MMSWVEEVLHSRGYTFEFEYGINDYSWRKTEVFSRDGHVFDLSDSGCSCNYFGEDWSTVDDVEANLFEVFQLPTLSELDGYDDKADTIRESYRKLGLR